MASARWTFALFLTLAACGPGAIDQPPVDAKQASFLTDIGMTFAEPATIGDPIPGAWTCDGACLLPGAHPALPPPVASTIAGTYGPSGDADTGAVSWSGDITGDIGAIAIPFATGPDNSNVSLNVTVDGRRISARMPPGGAWRFWRIRLARGEQRHHIEIRLRDTGSAASQWIAAGPPHTLKADPGP
jgi:hypothetical protein